MDLDFNSKLYSMLRDYCFYLATRNFLLMRTDGSVLISIYSPCGNEFTSIIILVLPLLIFVLVCLTILPLTSSICRLVVTALSERTANVILSLARTGYNVLLSDFPSQLVRRMLV
jgi:hypothetical protein